MAVPRISPEQFGPLFHGTSGTSSDVGELDQFQGGGPRYRMNHSYGWNFAATDINTAIHYAREAAHDEKKPAVVHEVTPRRKSEPWGPDPEPQPGEWTTHGPRSKREALDIVENGGSTSLRFRSPLRVTRREVWVEDKAKDVTNAVNGRMGIHDEKDAWGSNLSDYHTYGESFS